MTIQWLLKDIDLNKAIEEIPSQDPQTSLRFNIPVPNWLDDQGKPRFEHPAVLQKEDGSWRFYFQNYKDNCLQGVKIDGSSVITFMGPSPAQSKKLIALAGEYAADPEQLAPGHLADILERAHAELHLDDMYNNGRKGVESYMHPYHDAATSHPFFGAFLPKPTLSAAVYIQGAGAFMDGPTATPQQFENGAFISFPGQRKEQILSAPKDELLKSKNFTTKLVQADVFTRSRTYADGKTIDVAALPHQDAPSAGKPAIKAPTQTPK